MITHNIQYIILWNMTETSRTIDREIPKGAHEQDMFQKRKQALNLFGGKYFYTEYLLFNQSYTARKFVPLP